MMGGMLGNAIGGGAGDALSGLFGGGDLLGGSSSGLLLEGDVQIGTDVKFNHADCHGRHNHGPGHH